MPASTSPAATETREAESQARGDAARAQRDAGHHDPVVSPALHDLVRSISDGIRLFIPPAVLQPESAIRVTSSVLHQVVELQRTFLEELFAAGRDVVVSSDITPWQVEVRSNGQRFAA